MIIPELGKLVLFLGIVLVILGIVLIFENTIPFLGRLPGDIVIKKKDFAFYFPVTTCIVASIILTLIFWLFGRK